MIDTYPYPAGNNHDSMQLYGTELHFVNILLDFGSVQVSSD